MISGGSSWHANGLYIETMLNSDDIPFENTSDITWMVLAITIVVVLIVLRARRISKGKDKDKDKDKRLPPQA